MKNEFLTGLFAGQLIVCLTLVLFDKIIRGSATPTQFALSAALGAAFSYWVLS